MLDTKKPFRRGVFVTAAFGLPVALTLAACGSSSSGGKTSNGNGKPVSGGTLSFAINSDSFCVDPHQSPADVDGFFARPILDSLVSLSADGKISPWLATAWSVSPDQKT